MAELPDNSIQCVVTSPPYWGLRKYAGEQELIWGGDNHHEHEWGKTILKPRHHDGETNGGKEGNSSRIAKLRQASRERGGEYINETKTIGWQPTCKCNADKVLSIVLDPFAGAGTTLLVAAKLGRRAVGYEISEEYCRLSAERNKQYIFQCRSVKGLNATTRD